MQSATATVDPLYWKTNSVTADLPTPARSSSANGSQMSVEQQRFVSPVTTTANRRISEDRNASFGRNGGQKRRACNDCRQQKLRCDLAAKAETDGADACSRCVKLGLECKIDDQFQRTRKRKRSSELEKEVEGLKRQISTLSRQSFRLPVPMAQSPGYTGSDYWPRSSTRESDNGSVLSPNENSAVNFSTTMPSGTSPDSPDHNDPPGTTTRPTMDEDTECAPAAPLVPGMSVRASTVPSRTLDNIKITAEEIEELFTIYFDYFHPFLPMLERDKTPEEYYKASPLLYWAIISVAARRLESNPTLLSRLARSMTDLVWRTLAAVPHTKRVPQALALLCSWPFPTSSSTKDVSYMWVGMIIQTALQMGLHRPLSPQDFTKFRIKLTNHDISCRVRTWACSNIVTQSVSAGAGLAAPVQPDWAMGFAVQDGSPMKLLPELEIRLKIENSRSRVCRTLSANPCDPAGLPSLAERVPLYKVLEEELNALDGFSVGMSDINRHFILAAQLHLHSFFLFDEPSSEGYTERIIKMYSSASMLIQHALDLDARKQNFIRYCPIYVYQTFLTASFIMLKVLKNDYFRRYLDADAGAKMFNASVLAVRKMSVANNDLPGRLSDVLAYLWTEDDASLIGGKGKDGLQLRIRSRKSMSIVYDSLWRWRERFEEAKEPPVMVQRPVEPELPTPAPQAETATEIAAVTPDNSAFQFNADALYDFPTDAGFFDSMGGWDFNFDQNEFDLTFPGT